MKIVREKASKLALYVFADDAALTLGTTLVAPTFEAVDINSTDHEIVTGPAPLVWVSGILAYDADWQILDRDAYDDAVPVPVKVPRARARLTLSRQGLLAPIEAAVNAAGGEVLIWYQDAAEWFRADMNVIGISIALGWSFEQLDDLFRYAEHGFPIE